MAASVILALIYKGTLLHINHSDYVKVSYNLKVSWENIIIVTEVLFTTLKSLGQQNSQNEGWQPPLEVDLGLLTWDYRAVLINNNIDLGFDWPLPSISLLFILLALSPLQAIIKTQITSVRESTRRSYNWMTKTNIKNIASSRDFNIYFKGLLEGVKITCQGFLNQDSSLPILFMLIRYLVPLLRYVF